ncbi:DEAD/DEAH box helicase [Nitratifractor sp.]|uniref:DEAD/DEAH box helicase n=1 Tax=Nitratifractor sp. TaxID=2268144 RepID=UPI0025EA5693|nr:DEAD/DEAH box helicase [Nitratifractor sp.]
MTFEDFNFRPELAAAIREAGFREPSPVQKEAIPLVLEGRDLVAQAHTGTGKTAAFGLPVLQQLRCDGSVEALVIVPTRELATQVSDEIFRFGKALGIRTATVYGGSSYTRQIQHVASASVVVATPGRLIDLLQSGKINLSPRFVILDEADEMLDMGFLDDIREIFTHLSAERQTLLFSATMSREIKALAQTILRNPATVSITGGNVTNDKIRQLFYVVEEQERDDALVRLLDYKNPDKSIIFCRMKKEVDRLRDYLAAQGYEARGLHGDMDQRQREATIRAFKSGGAEILIATDVAARGLDVNDVSHVFNYHLPFDPESYVHRIGRTGRAGREGTAISIVSPHEFRSLQRIQKSVGSTIESRIIPRIEEVRNRRSDALIERIESQEVDAASYALIETLKEEYDLTTLAGKLLSMVREEEEIRGADRIGKDLAEIERLFARMKEERHHKKGRGRYNNRRSYNRSGPRKKEYNRR